MASRRGNGIGKTILLLFLICILVLGGLLWFDYLGLITAKQFFAPVYNLIGLSPQTSATLTSGNTIFSDIDEDRYAKRLEALNIRTQELDKREQDIVLAEQRNVQIEQELEDRRIAQEEREKTFNNTIKKYDDREVNIVQNVQNLTGMQPQNAVDIMIAMDDQDVIDILRKADEMAAAEGSASMVAYWLSLMPPERAAQIQRKMLIKPTSLEAVSAVTDTAAAPAAAATTAPAAAQQ